MGNDFNSLSCSAWSNLGANYPISDDRSTSFWTEFGSGAVPRNVIVDMGGIVRYNATGFNETAITNVLNQLLTSTDTTPEATIPQVPVLISSYPNPFNARTQIKVDLARSGVTKLVIYNSSGEEMETLVNSYLGQGDHTFSWEGHDAQGNDLPAGVYLARLESSGQIATRKLLLLK